MEDPTLEVPAKSLVNLDYGSMLVIWVGGQQASGARQDALAFRSYFRTYITESTV